MLRQFNTLLLIFFLLTVIACEKQKSTNELGIEESTNTTVDINPFDTLLIWQIEDSFISPGYLKLYKDLIITSKEPVLGETYVSAYNSDCGELAWQHPLNISHIPRSHKSKVIDDVIVESSQNWQIVLDAQTGNELWKANVDEDFGHNFTRNSVVNYTNSILTNQIKTNDRSISYLVNLNLRNFRKIFEITNDSVYRYSPVAPITNILKDGDTLIYALAHKYAHTTNEQEVDMYCYNISRQNMVWQKNSFDSHFNVYPTQIDLETNSIIVLGLRCVYSFDLLTGKENWRHERGWPHNMLGSNYLIGKEKVIFGEDIGPVVALNKFTGELIWENDEFCCQIHDIKVYENVVLANGGWLMFLDLETGKTKYIIKDPDVSSNLFGGTAIDTELKRIYIADYSYLYALKIPNFE